MIRLFFGSACLLPILFYLIWGYGFQGFELLRSLSTLIFIWGIITGLETYLTKNHVPHLTSFLIGLPLGYFLGQFLIFSLEHFSMLIPILETIPFKSFIYILSIYGIIHLFIHFSTFTHKIYLVHSHEVKENNRILRFLRLTTYTLFLGLILLVSLHFMGGNEPNNQWGLPPQTISAMNNAGYDFELSLKNPYGKHSLLWLLGIIYVALVEFILKRRLIPILMVILPSSIFACSGYLFTEHILLWISLPSWLPSNLIQIYSLFLWFYLGLMLSYQCYRLKHYKLLFWEIRLED